MIFSLILITKAFAQEDTTVAAIEPTTEGPTTINPRINGFCWSCGVKNNVTDFGPQDSVEDMYNRCIEEGFQQDCLDERDSCAIVERMSSDGFVMSIESGCKARDACIIQQSANFNGANGECTRGAGKPSKCYDCCLVDTEGDSCNLEKFGVYIAAAYSDDLDAEVSDAWNQTVSMPTEEPIYEDQPEE